MLFALALDAKYLYAGNCGEADNCEIERLRAEDYPGGPTLMQAGIHSLANIEVDEKEIFWVDLGHKKPICANEVIGDSDKVEYRCRDPVPPRLMAADKNEPRATARAAFTAFRRRAATINWFCRRVSCRVSPPPEARSSSPPTEASFARATAGPSSHCSEPRTHPMAWRSTPTSSTGSTPTRMRPIATPSFAGTADRLRCRASASARRSRSSSRAS
jgi:hypothetical protein